MTSGLTKKCLILYFRIEEFSFEFYANWPEFVNRVCIILYSI